MAALLADRLLGQRGGTVVPMLPPRAEAGEAWLGVFTGADTRIGTLRLVQTAEERNGTAGSTLRLNGDLRFAVLGEVTTMRIQGSLWRALAGGAASFDVTLRAGSSATRVQADIAGGELSGTVTTAGEQVPFRLRTDPKILAGGTLPWRLQPIVLAVGEELALDAFDPFSLQTAKLRLRCVREESVLFGGQLRRTRVVEGQSGASTFTLWLADDGDILQAKSPMGLSFRQLDRSEALADPGASAGAELYERVRIVPVGRPPRRGVHRLLVRWSGIDQAITIPSDDTQRLLDAQRLEVTAPRAAEVEAVAAAAAAPAQHAELADALAADPLVQSSHARIRAQARTIVGKESDPWRIARRIHDWVFREIDKEIVASLPSALDVLSTRVGDCNEHTVLFTALARAAGVPTRIAIGVVWSDELGGFGYHAWPEVWVGRWVWMDPTLGQPIADATHIKLVSGSFERWPQVMAFLGRLQLEILEAE